MDRTTGRVFFFQAEDGIRDLYVTGVQTCALPICIVASPSATLPATGSVALGEATMRANAGSRMARSTMRTWSRSEERRVGKECRCRGAAAHHKKKVQDSVEPVSQRVRGNRMACSM